MDKDYNDFVMRMGDFDMDFENEESSDELMHYGVKGQKWGVRRYQKADGTYTSAGKKRRAEKMSTWSDDAKSAHDIKQKKVKQMSNAELKKLNERTRLEQEYSRLNPNAVQQGWKYVVAGAAAMGTIAGLYNNSNTVVKIGKNVVNRMKYKQLTLF